MKNHITLSLAIVAGICAQDIGASIKMKPQGDIRSKNNPRRRRSLERFFNLNADAQQNMISEQEPTVMQMPAAEPIMPAYPAFPEEPDIPTTEMPEMYEPEDESFDELRASAAREERKQNVQASQEAVNKVLTKEPPAVYRAKPIAEAEEHQEDMQQKREAVIQLVNRAIDYLKNNNANETLSKISHTKEFVMGDLYVFVYNRQGVCLANPQHPDLLWQNLYNMQDAFGRHVVQVIIKQAEDGGGWVNYEWEKATKLAYVQQVEKDGEVYIIGSGFFSHSKRDAVINLVKSAVAYFNNIVQKGLSASVAFSVFNYPNGDFEQGDLSLYSVSFDGDLVSNSENAGYVGTTNAFEYQDANGKHINKDIVRKLENSKEGIWEEYVSNRATKRVYAEKVQDAKGKWYFIACGYYPDCDRDQAIGLVRKAYRYMKSNGAGVALHEFSSKSNDEFRHGNLHITVYTLDGKCVANGNNAALVGKNRFNLQDSEGHYYVREMIAKAKEGGGWINYKTSKLFRSAYVELIDMGIEQYVIATFLFPISKQETTMLMVKGAASYLESAGLSTALGEFIKKNSKFRRGDLYVFVLEENGICLAYGDEYDLIWRNLVKEGAKDENGKPFIKNMIEFAKHGPGIVKYKLNKAEKAFYIEPFSKNGKNYIIGSGYYL